ncbi:MAG: hypothetical protein WCD69_12580 [Xanthobacteraceae bacterium]
MDWNPINSAPFDHEVEIAVIDGQGEHALIFPCRRAGQRLGRCTNQQAALPHTAYTLAGLVIWSNAFQD